MSDAAVSWKPAGWQSVICGLSIPNAKAALDFYKDAFGAELIGMMLDKKGEMVMHASIKLHDTVFYVSDPYPELGYPASTLNAFFYVPDCDAAFKKAVAAGAKEVSAPAQQFWGDRTGKLTDPFGLTWTLATKTEEPSKEQIQEAGRDWERNMDNTATSSQ